METSESKLLDDQQIRWRKILYKDQGVPDNYVHSSFLQEMKKNIFVRKYDYKVLVRSSVVLTQQLCVVLILVLLWWYMGENILSPETVLLVSLVTTCFGYSLYLGINSFPVETTKFRLFRDIKTAAMMVGFTTFFAPVLKTLTHTISTDTIYAMTVFMWIGHLLCHDYDPKNQFALRSVSFNMAVFAAVCLASRLETTIHTFAVVISALQLFGLWPILRQTLSEHKPVILEVFTAVLCIFIFISLQPINMLASFAFLSGCISITFVFPSILISLQSHKNNIHGPWDEAVI
ncbi:phosphatidylinositol N-acetylglucosaminyltransferase subunit C-like [Clavelina lepadiformis]|uniref:phosphatidylinositol N-acetylglucosaminyltransferase subunit C-like n=1 Tax=Clavelina lepadiformis TaxID=159417 RepID=UPI00404247E6